MTEVSRIVDQLEREFDGDPWHGSPLEAILEGIDAKRAAARPIASGHSIWELVLHMIGWKDETTRRLSGAVARAGDWPAIGEATDANAGGRHFAQARSVAPRAAPGGRGLARSSPL